MQKRGKTALTLVGFAGMLAALLALMAGVADRALDQRKGVFGLPHRERPCARISECL